MADTTFQPGQEHGTMPNGLLKIAAYRADGSYIGSFVRGGDFPTACADIRLANREAFRGSIDDATVTAFWRSPANRISVLRCGEMQEST